MWLYNIGMEKVEISGNKPVQLTLNLTERSTVFVFTQTSEPVSIRREPLVKPTSEKLISPSVVYGLMHDWDFYGKDEMDTWKAESYMWDALRAARGNSNNEDDLVAIEEDISVTIDEAKIEGKKFASKPRKIRDFRQLVYGMIEDVWTESLPGQNKSA